MRLLFALVVGLLFLGSVVSAAAQTPEASPVAPSAAAICNPAVSGTPEVTAQAPIDVATVAFDQIVIDALLPFTDSSFSLASVIRERTQHPPMTDFADLVVNLNTDWQTRLAAMRASLYPDTSVLSDQDVALGIAMHMSASPGRGGAPGLDGISAAHQVESLAGLCEAEIDPDLVFIDAMIGQFSAVLIVTGLAATDAMEADVQAIAIEIQDEINAEIDQLNLWRQTWFPNAPYTDDHGEG